MKKVISNKQKQKLGNSKSKRDKNAGGETASISPLLAEWAKEDDGDVTTTTTTTTTTTKSATSSDVFVPFDETTTDNTKKRKSNKKAKQTARAALSSAQVAQMDELIDGINDMIQTTNCDVDELVSNIASLVDVGSSFESNNRVLLPTLKSIVSSRQEKQPSYRLAWVGSDDAICHIGTSLHKLPLARLQEMYLLLGYGRWELLEVIRVLGPFPNVRNTLKGELKLGKLGNNNGDVDGGREGVRMEISYNSMIDGTGKEILAGKDDNVKVVNLDVWFANDKAIVCTVPRGSEEGDEGENNDGDSAEGDPLRGDGSNILLFVAEENLDEELEKLRAA